MSKNNKVTIEDMFHIGKVKVVVNGKTVFISRDSAESLGLI